MSSRLALQYVNDFAERLSGIATLDGLTQVFHESVTDLGFDAFALHIVSLSGMPGRVVYGVTTYPDEWVKRYREAGYVQIDPVISNGLSRQMPFEWREVLAGMPLNERQRRFFGEAGEFGILEGLTMPIHGQNGQFSAITLTTSLRGKLADRIIRANRYVAQRLCLHYHEVVGARLLARVKGADAPARDEPRLTERERDCLRWAAQGKTAWEIAKLLNIGERTVVFHIENAKQKLGVHSRQHAVVRAVMAGLINL